MHTLISGLIQIVKSVQRKNPDIIASDIINQSDESIRNPDHMHESTDAVLGSLKSKVLNSVMLKKLLRVVQSYFFFRFWMFSEPLSENPRENPKRGTVTKRVFQKKYPERSVASFVYVPVLWIFSEKRAR